MSNNSENVVWRGHPSQLLNFWTHLVSVVLAIAIIAGSFISGFVPLAALALLPLGWSFWSYLVVRCRVYELTSERLRLFEGVLNQHIDEVELYRVKDTTIIRPFWLRLFGLSSIKVDSSDRTHPVVHLSAIKDGINVREIIREHVEVLREKKRVREVDFDGSGDGDEIEFEG